MMGKMRGKRPQDYQKWFELLSRTIEELNNFPPGGDLYTFIADTLKPIGSDLLEFQRRLMAPAAPGQAG